MHSVFVITHDWVICNIFPCRLFYCLRFNPIAISDYFTSETYIIRPKTIAIDKQMIKGGGRGLTRTKVLLNREWDLTGIGDKLTMNKISGRLQVATQDEEY